MKEKLKTKFERGSIRHAKRMNAPFIYNLEENKIDVGGDYRWFNFYGRSCKIDPANWGFENIILGDK